MRQLLETLEPTILLLTAGVLRRWAQKSGDFDLRDYDRRLLLDGLREKRATPTQIVEYVRTLPLDYRARYNLACYFAGVADTASSRSEPSARSRTTEADDRALSELAAALKSSPWDLVEWAKDDPSLGGIRKRRPSKFGALIDELSPKPEPGSSTDATRASEPQS
jgi:hypothetical protein